MPRQKHLLRAIWLLMASTKISGIPSYDSLMVSTFVLSALKRIEQLVVRHALRKDDLICLGAVNLERLAGVGSAHGEGRMRDRIARDVTRRNQFQLEGVLR